MVIRFFLFCKKEIIFETIFWIVAIQNQILDRAFPKPSSSNSSSGVTLSRF